MQERQGFPPAWETQITQNSPGQVVRETGILLPMYLSDRLENTTLARLYFKRHTFEFLRDATTGFLFSPQITRSRLSREELTRLIWEDEIIHSDGFQHEKSVKSYAIAMAIFLHMPNPTAETVYIPGIPILNGLILKPPRDSMETLDRINELERFVAGVANGEITHRTPLRTDDSIVRGLAFFQTGRNLFEEFSPSTGKAIREMM